MTLLAIFFLAYLFVAPDKGTLMATRGFAGALRAAAGRPPRKSRTAKGSSSKGNTRSKATGGGDSRSLLDGWREGVAAARQVREEGRDVWSRGSRIAGRAAGGTRSVVSGIRATVGDRRDRHNPASIPEPDASPIDVPTTDPVPSNDDDIHADLDQDLEETHRPQDGELLFSSKTDDLGAAIGQPVKQETKLDELVDHQVSDEAAAAVGGDELPTDDRYYVWKSPDSGQSFVFDRMTLDEPMACLSEREAGVKATFWNGRHDLAMQNGWAATALVEQADRETDNRNHKRRHVQIHGPETQICPTCGGQAVRVDNSFDADPGAMTWSYIYRCPTCSTETRLGKPLTLSQFELIFPHLAADLPPVRTFEPALAGIPQTPAAAPAAGSTHPSTITRKDASPMAIAGTELGNLDEVDGEAKAALNAIEALTEALNEIKGWGGNLPDRWSGTSWSTDGLDAAIVGVAEEAAELKIPEALMERLTQIGTEVQEARRVGEVAAEARARGDLSGFLSN